MRSTFDANILVYAADRESGPRHGQALSLLRRAIGSDCVLTMQTLGEFFHVVTRKRIVPVADAAEMLVHWRTLLPTHAAGADCLAAAVAAVREHDLSFWDAMLWATAREAGCSYLFSEDFQDGRQLGGVIFVDPFAAANASLLAAALEN